MYMFQLISSVNIQGCKQVGKSMSVSPSAVLAGLIILTSFVVSPAVIKVPGTDWMEPILIWLTISMPTGSRKTTIYQFLLKLLREIRQKANCSGMCFLIVMHMSDYISLQI